MKLSWPKPAEQDEEALSKRRQSRKKSTPTALPPESSTSQGVTVFWMTTLLATVVSQAIALGLRVSLWFQPWSTADFLAHLMLFIAATTGLVCLVCTPIVLRWRDTPPPRAITIFAIAASVLPLATLAALLLFGS